MTTKPNPEVQMDFFFWLGEDGNATPVTKEAFDEKIEEKRKDNERRRKEGIDVI